MTHPIGDALGDIEGFAHRVGHDITSIVRHTSYHSTQQHQPAAPEGTPAMTLDLNAIKEDLGEWPSSVRDWASRVDSYAGEMIAKLERYESEPMVEDVLTALETIPQARAVLMPVLAGLKGLSAVLPGAKTQTIGAAAGGSQTLAVEIPTAGKPSK